MTLHVMMGSDSQVANRALKWRLGMEKAKATRSVPEIPQGVAWAALLGFLAFVGYSLFDMNGRLSKVENGLMTVQEGLVQLVEDQDEIKMRLYALESGQKALEAGQDQLGEEIRELLRILLESGDASSP